MRVIHHAKTDRGLRRKLNEDYFAVSRDEKLFVVLDGMGGHAGGKVASELAGRSIISYYAEHGVSTGTVKMPHVLFQEAIAFANHKVLEKAQESGSLSGMGTTLVAAMLGEDGMEVAHVGDSRAYLVRKGRLTRLTRDHSLVQEQLEGKWIGETDTPTHQLRHIITRALGRQPRVEADFSKVPLRSGDYLVFCTDGLYEHLSGAEIAEIVRGCGADLRGACDRAVALANERGGRDNITLLVILVEEAGKGPAGGGLIRRVFGRLKRS